MSKLDTKWNTNTNMKNKPYRLHTTPKCTSLAQLHKLLQAYGIDSQSCAQGKNSKEKADK